MEEVKKGRYQHYKGGEYKVLYLVKNSETKEDMVVYQDINHEDKLWVRPKKMFLEEVEVAGIKKPRFEFISEEEIDSWENKYLRALADYQNLIKQNAKDRQELIKYAVNDFLHDLLPVYDHLKMSLVGISEEAAKNPWAQGVIHVLKQFKDVLAAQGIEEIKAIGEKFNHETMEAVDGSGEIVKQEIMTGYKLNGKVIRPAKVVVSE